MQSEQLIQTLAQYLVSAVVASGKKIKAPGIGVASISIQIFDTGNAYVENQLNGWRIPIEVTLDWDKKESPRGNES